MHRGCVTIIISGSVVILLASLALRFFFTTEYQQKGSAQIIYVIEKAMGEYKEDYGTYPEGGNSNVVNILLGNNSRQKLYLPRDSTVIRNGVMVDLWKHPLQINVKGNSLVVISAGKNKHFGDDDDITSQLARDRHQVQGEHDNN